jgi:hypothetical protein
MISVFSEFISIFEPVRRQYSFRLINGSVRAIKYPNGKQPPQKAPEGGFYVNDEYAYCPITALCAFKTGINYKATDYVYAAYELNLSDNLATDIALASDYDAPEPNWPAEYTNYLSHIREYLTSICN